MLSPLQSLSRQDYPPMLTEATHFHFLPTCFHDAESLFQNFLQFLFDIPKLHSSFFPSKVLCSPVPDVLMTLF